MAYCTAAQVKTYLGGTWGSGDDTLLGDLIDRAQAMIEAETNRVFEASADSTRNFDVSVDVAGDWLYFDEDLATTPTTVTNNADGGANAETLTAGTHYVLYPRNETPYHSMKLLSSGNKSWTYTDDPELGITIEGKWAYSTTAPDDIVQACIQLAAWLYRRRSSVGTDGDRPLATGDGVVIMDASIPSIVKAVIRKYRKRVR